MQTRTPDGPPVISAIIIFLNAERYIEEAIESVFAQTYRHWELLLVDDGSTDGSSAIAQRYAERFPDQVRYLTHPEHENRGMSASRNRGLAEARGEYVAFLDADDVWRATKLRRQLTLLEAHPEAGMVYGPTLLWYSWTNVPEDGELDAFSELLVPPNQLYQPPYLLTSFLRTGGGNVPGICSLLIRRTAILQVGGFEESFRGCFEDQVFISKICLSQPVYVSDQCLDCYRQHAESCCNVEIRTGDYHPARPNPKRERYLNWLQKHLEEKQMQGTECYAALEWQLWPYRNPTLYRCLFPVVWLRRLYLFKRAARRLGRIANRILPEPVYLWLRHMWTGRPQRGLVRFGNFRRLVPMSDRFGFDRGQPIDRFYIERFLEQSAKDIRGRVLEVGEDLYTRRFGAGQVEQTDILDVTAKNPQATFVADLNHGDHLPSEAFDCIILTQTLQLIYDVRAAVSTLHRILKPGGVLLATVPGLTQTTGDKGDYDWYWSFTTLSVRSLFEEAFPDGDVQVQFHGNVLSTIAFLHGMATEELKPRELEHRDSRYQMLITIRAQKPAVRRAVPEENGREAAQPSPDSPPAEADARVPDANLVMNAVH